MPKSVTDHGPAVRNALEGTLTVSGPTPTPRPRTRRTARDGGRNLEPVSLRPRGPARRCCPRPAAHHLPRVAGPRRPRAAACSGSPGACAAPPRPGARCSAGAPGRGAALPALQRTRWGVCCRAAASSLLPALRRSLTTARKLAARVRTAARPAPPGRFKLGASEMMGKDSAMATMGPTKMSQVSIRQVNAPQHKRPSLGKTYAPSPAPGETIDIVRKKILKRQSMSPSRETSLLGTSPDSPPRERIGTAGSNSVKFLDTEKRDGSSLPSLPPWLGADSLGPRVGDATTPRALWRKQVRVWSLHVGVRLACWCGTGSLTMFSA